MQEEGQGNVNNSKLICITDSRYYRKSRSMCLGFFCSSGYPLCY
jgi:hypothetical protein